MSELKSGIPSEKKGGGGLATSPLCQPENKVVEWVTFVYSFFTPLFTFAIQIPGQFKILSSLV